MKLSNVIEVFSTRTYKAGYVVRDELVQVIGNDPTNKETTLRAKRAYTLNGEYIGESTWAKKLYRDMGITPQYYAKNKNICSIGFCEKEQKWYGWSHRALYGFGIGSEVVKGDCAYCATNLQEEIESAVRFWEDVSHENTYSDSIVRQDASGKKFITVKWDYYGARHPNIDKILPNISLRGSSSDIRWHLPEEFGRGEWKAKTLDDAKEMAIAFARGVD